MTITIDGPTASGKSSVGRMLAQKLNYYYIYSGLLYRALAYQLLNEYGYDEQTITQPRHHDVRDVIAQMRYEYSNTEHLFLRDTEITSYLKDKRIDQLASLVSTNKLVRDQIDAWQRTIANEHNVVVDGRDAGTVVFPDAEYKFFLTARPQIRAERWRGQQKKYAHQPSFDEALDFITLRDTRDSNRELAPLKIAENGIMIDNSDLNLSDTVEKILELIKKK